MVRQYRKLDEDFRPGAVKARLRARLLQILAEDLQRSSGL
jgi:hypothetical protein